MGPSVMPGFRSSFLAIKSIFAFARRAYFQPEDVDRPLALHLESCRAAYSRRRCTLDHALSSISSTPFLLTPPSQALQAFQAAMSCSVAGARGSDHSKPRMPCFMSISQTILELRPHGLAFFSKVQSSPAPVWQCFITLPKHLEAELAGG